MSIGLLITALWVRQFKFERTNERTLIVRQLKCLGLVVVPIYERMYLDKQSSGRSSHLSS